MRRILSFVTATLVLLGVLATPVGASADSPRSAAARRVPSVDAPGRWAVGRSTFTVSDPDRPGRTLTVDAWYPARPADVVGRPKSAIDLVLTQIESPTAYDNPPVVPGMRFPLVVFSHGSGGIRFQSWFLMEHLASHGFIVVAPDHAGNTALDGLFGTQTPFEVSARNRPLDVSLVISHMLARNTTPGDAFVDHLHPRRIAVMGHSFGGFTAVAAAAGYQDIPADRRVRAIIPVAAATSGFSDAALASIRVPSLWLHGTRDGTVDFAQTLRAWPLLRTSPRVRADLLGGGHSSFTNACDLLDALEPLGLPPDLLGFLRDSADDACGPDLVDIDRAWSVTRITTLAFLEVTLNRDQSFIRYLRPGLLRRHPVHLTFR